MSGGTGVILHATPAPTEEMIRRNVRYARTIPGEYVLRYDGIPRRQMTTFMVMNAAQRNQKNLKITGMFSALRRLW